MSMSIRMRMAGFLGLGWVLLASGASAGGWAYSVGNTTLGAKRTGTAYEEKGNYVMSDSAHRLYKFGSSVELGRLRLFANEQACETHMWRNGSYLGVKSRLASTTAQKGLLTGGWWDHTFAPIVKYVWLAGAQIDLEVTPSQTLMAFAAVTWEDDWYWGRRVRLVKSLGFVMTSNASLAFRVRSSSSPVEIKSNSTGDLGGVPTSGRFQHVMADQDALASLSDVKVKFSAANLVFGVTNLRTRESPEYLVWSSNAETGYLVLLSGGY
jgi:hypothetical protein